VARRVRAPVTLKGRDLISIRDLSRDEIEEVLRSSKRMIPYAEGTKLGDQLAGKLVTLAFFEPSTRTRLSFETAVQRLGGRCVTIADPSASSMRKGETLHDTIRMLSSYGDAIVLRHPNEGSGRLAAQASDKPVINAGDGAGQHPTQTLLDLATMQEAFGTLSGLKVVLLGDLKYGRTVHSLAYALAVFGAELVLSAPPGLGLPEEVRSQLDQMGAKTSEEEQVHRVVRDADVLYVTRIQKERFVDLAEYEKVAGSYRIDGGLLKTAKQRLIVMHPLPRTGEIAPEVDATAHAAYFRQAFLGVPVRMALLSLILTGKAG
jgi:aspartate carbamoyltransferase catalytic subunit